jgi:hypothetical protein
MKSHVFPYGTWNKTVRNSNLDSKQVYSAYMKEHSSFFLRYYQITVQTQIVEHNKGDYLSKY